VKIPHGCFSGFPLACIIYCKKGTVKVAGN
jgi:hypothetical protein